MVQLYLNTHLTIVKNLKIVEISEESQLQSFDQMVFTILKI